MTILSDSTIDPATWHPSWCDPAECSAPDRLEARGLTEADVPLHRRHAHYSAPVTIGDPVREDAVITVRAERFVDQPPDEPGVDAVELVLEHRLHGTRVVALLEPDLLDQLAVAIAEMRALAELPSVPSGPPRSMVDRAVRALTYFGVLNRSDAMRLLPLWPLVAELSGEQQEAVWESFPVRLDGGR